MTIKLVHSADKVEQNIFLYISDQYFKKVLNIKILQSARH